MFNYDKVLKDKKLNFNSFKTIYGAPGDRKGVRAVKVGNDTLLVDKTNYTYSVAPPPENEAKKRLLAQTHSS